MTVAARGTRVESKSAVYMGREKMVDNVGLVQSQSGVGPMRRSKTAYRLNELPKEKDSVQLSGVMRLNGIEGGIRMERVMAVKSEIQAGTYFTPEKFDIAMDRALDQLFG